MGAFEYSFDESILSPVDEEIVRVVFTTPLNEGHLRDFCNEHGIVNYLPLRKTFLLKRHVRNGKSYQYQSIVLRPMFPNYIFVKLQPEQRSQIFRSNTVVRILADEDQRSRKLIDEIRVIRRIEEIAKTEELEFNPTIKEGGKFLIESGPWQGVYGWLKKKRKRSLWTVEIECVNSLVQATIDPSQYKMSAVEE